MIHYRVLIGVVVFMAGVAAISGIAASSGVAGPESAGVAESDSAPSLIQSSRVLPVYPEPERKAGIQGTVLLNVEIKADGTVGKVSAKQEVEGHPAFTSSAIAAVVKWRFEPAREGDKAVAVQVVIPIRFALDEKK